MFGRRIASFALVSILGTLPVSSHALTMPNTTVGVGTSVGVTGLPGDGGLTMHAAATWPVLGRFRFGVAGYADDLGTEVTRLLAPVTYADLGLHAERHRWSWGVAWLGETSLAKRGRWGLDGRATWGFHRIEDDERGETLRAISAVGVGVGLAGHRTIAAGQSLGVAIRWQQVFLDRNDDGDSPPTFVPETPVAQQEFLTRQWELQARHNLPSGWGSAALEWRWGGR